MIKENKSSLCVAVAHTVIHTTNTKKEYPVIIDRGGMQVKVNEGG
ncbi:MAG TPA: hypothetical protein PK348_03195 [Spirochaetota bacterium]|nr:hypothetical protein [Spirochaetota bacterium]